MREFARGLNPAMLSDQNRVGRFIRFHSTNGALVKALATDADVSAVMEPTRYARDAHGVPYGVLLVPLRDGAGDSLGVMRRRAISAARVRQPAVLVWQMCIAVFAIVILAGAVIVVVRGFLLRPLDVLDRRASPRWPWANGDRARADRQVLQRDRPPGGPPTSESARARR